MNLSDGAMRLGLWIARAGKGRPSCRGRCGYLRCDEIE